MSKYAGHKNLQANPANTDLRLIHDNRSGVRLEIVIPVFDEEKRINNIIHYYNGFDIVLLDGGSTDRTIEIAIKCGATVYSRVGDAVGENHFTYYANSVSKSGYCFYMMADELINKNDLKEAAEHLRNEDSVIGVRKIEWIYCEEPMTKRSPALGMPRGFRQGTAVYDPYNIHNSLLHVTNPNLGTRMFVYDLHHLHIKSIKGEYGKFGKYLDAEIWQMHERNATVPNYIRRFFIPILVAVFWRIWFNKTSIPCKLFRILELVMASQLAMMCWIERKFMPSVDEQMACYSSKYFNDE